MKENLEYFIKGNFVHRELQSQTLFKNTVTRYIAYFIQYPFIHLLIFLNNILKKKKTHYRHTISICCIFKNESEFLDEWIKFHLVIGIDHFYLYNNNSDDDYIGILQPYIDKGVVDLFDWPHKHSQMQAYEHCYKNFNNDTHWLTFIDIDEFICPISTNNIKGWLSNYKKYPGVAVYWKQFGSSGKMKHDHNKLVIEQYTQCWPKYSTFTKMFCNMKFSFKPFENPHKMNAKILGFNIPPINQFKKLINFGINRISKNSKTNIQINHYWGKAYDCFVKNKINKTDVYHEDDFNQSLLRNNLLKSHESLCKERDFEIQKFLLFTKLYNNKY
ncbi:glycosyltransferase family 2 protein [Mucilaginibacter sp. RS28]|uniref:Glycosyltransferase family 2 protein n=1 Tax=Mucilaginibacter straminoryzae TaxID=2932774 RepID=A0A9X1X252_9SPHI|nr:glycosyltransferase family 2 protein [Mucilaginibacter straminoryzae]MCJ8208570.1 glycosyltransferase family 2 protein [Mucilaginibacter straminoryzae]